MVTVAYTGSTKPWADAVYTPSCTVALMAASSVSAAPAVPESAWLTQLATALLAKVAPVTTSYSPSAIKSVRPMN